MARHADLIERDDAIRGGTPRLPTRRERIAIDAAEGWAAACMDPAEWALWVAENPVTSITDGMVADRPCVDCPLGFAADMRAIGRCNGSPGAVGGRHEQPEEGEDDMNDLRPSGGGRGFATLALQAPPCATCTHEPICVLKIALKKATSVEIGALSLPDGLSVEVSAKVECRFYDRVKGSRGGVAGRKLNLSDEERARRGEQARANTAAKLAAKAGAEA